MGLTGYTAIAAPPSAARTLACKVYGPGSLYPEARKVYGLGPLYRGARKVYGLGPLYRRARKNYGLGPLYPGSPFQGKPGVSGPEMGCSDIDPYVLHQTNYGTTTVTT
ncbi:hypothetical protein T492DRAFT_944665 [Pavlovales sp. CCMP2436]|nr:hypothetical protein T492DRAFT_944665 [Pavlovales sp. CCMP2436]